MNTHPTRRDFLRGSLLAGLAAAASPLAVLARAAAPAAAATGTASRVALFAGTDRADLVFRSLKQFGPALRQAIGNRHVVLKPNNVAIDNPLCATHADCLEGALEFLKSIGKLGNAVIAESAASGPTLDGFANYHYDRLAGKYGVKLVDLDVEPVDVVQVFDEKDFRPHGVRMASRLLDPNAFIISATRFKTHDRVVATLSLKNIIVGTAVKDPGFRWGPGSKAGAQNDKPLIHGNGFRGINYNLFAVAQRLHPHLAILDGVEGMEGNGPVGGTAVDHRVCVVSPDWLAADRVALELMGIDFARVGYLNYCAQAKLGEADLSKIEIVGEPIAPHVKTYKLSQNIQEQLIWQKPVAS
jgi:uncharacterized protein (DUF362 family)